ncbi:hypothetical protein [Paraglaciecola sp.]|uniref:hypothetical protein n=1 Tax=Paraglaciecola sp. TaxID=1920173 RepID=UPI0032661647
MKTKFLTCYDYGQGGIWRFVFAESKEQLSQLYPELHIVNEQPPWMEKDDLDRMEKLSIDIEETGAQFFKAIISERRSLSDE